MAAHTFDDIANHAGHRLEVGIYANQNAAVECVDCYQVLLDFDKEGA